MTRRRWLLVRIWIAVAVPSLTALVAFGGYEGGGTGGAAVGACIGFFGGSAGAYLALRGIRR